MPRRPLLSRTPLKYTRQFRLARILQSRRPTKGLPSRRNRERAKSKFPQLSLLLNREILSRNRLILEKSAHGSVRVLFTAGRGAEDKDEDEDRAGASCANGRGESAGPLAERNIFSGR